MISVRPEGEKRRFKFVRSLGEGEQIKAARPTMGQLVNIAFQKIPSIITKIIAGSKKC